MNIRKLYTECCNRSLLTVSFGGLSATRSDRWLTVRQGNTRSDRWLTIRQGNTRSDRWLTVRQGNTRSDRWLTVRQGNTRSDRWLTVHQGSTHSDRWLTVRQGTTQSDRWFCNEKRGRLKQLLDADVQPYPHRNGSDFRWSEERITSLIQPNFRQ